MYLRLFIFSCYNRGLVTMVTTLIHTTDGTERTRMLKSRIDAKKSQLLAAEQSLPSSTTVGRSMSSHIVERDSSFLDCLQVFMLAADSLHASCQAPF